MFSLARYTPPSPVTIMIPAGRPRVVTTECSIPTATGIPRTFDHFDVAFAINPTTRTVHAQIAPIPKALLIYGPDDFSAAAADTPEQHVERISEVVGDDPQAMLQALADGRPLPPTPPRVPREIPNWRAKAVLHQMGMLPRIEAFFATLDEPQRTVVGLAWNGDAKVARRSATIQTLASVLGWTDAQIDAMFIAADAITL